MKKEVQDKEQSFRRKLWKEPQKQFI